ncbi:N-methyl-L-tryptophan oxidase [Maritalea mediterranea]|uniref:N-methyl-L-tryptophan oxidase n=1 Tax=Maritalea mediterranea TaxID=2909667 RepID=A0ABS9E8D5_9HYPH|nr:N-methyl-L-tryptophan oxidase [Maritalea mediterranea]MCF4099140.1 N-methyl-L-tryptophan oxidase [Maritalea mediterranea]
MQQYDVIVVGLGAMGSAAAFQLAKTGAKTLGLDRHTPPHIHGSTHGESRLTRQAIGEGLAYVPFVLRSHEIWRQIEAETGETLLHQIGALMISSTKSTAKASAKKGFLATTESAAKAFGIAHEILSPDEVRQRFPNFLIADNEFAYFEPGAGYLRVEQCVDNQLKLAEKYGADLRYGNAVEQLNPQADGSVVVRTHSNSYIAAKVILSAGPWVRSFLPKKWHDIFQPTRQVLHWLDIEPAGQAAWKNSPAFAWPHGEKPDDFFYGMTSLSAPHQFKMASEFYGTPTEPEQTNRDVSNAEQKDFYTRHVEGRLSGLNPNVVRSATCLYTAAPDGHFIMDHHPELENVFLVSPCSGHGFKHSAAIGEMLAHLMTKGETSFDISPFKLSRFDVP